MIVLGFVLIVAAVAAAVVLITQNAGALDVHALGQTWSLNAYWLVVAGLVAMAVAVLGIAMVRQAGVRTHQAHRRIAAESADERPMNTADTTRTTTVPSSTERPPKRSLFRHHASGA